VEDFWVPLLALSVLFALLFESGRTHLVHYVLERVGAIDGEADEEKICFGI